MKQEPTYEGNYAKAKALVAYFKRQHKVRPFLGFDEDYKWSVLQFGIKMKKFVSRTICTVYVHMYR